MSTERPLFDSLSCYISEVKAFTPEPPVILSYGGSNIPIGEKRLIVSIQQSKQYIQNTIAGEALYLKVYCAMADPACISCFFIVEKGIASEH